ncbi:rifin PIR protein, putative [Plasmodium reichenowi]|uniref:Rifin PIR protein, putative n=1 Tax=Plasmodium reichenowi TaxID=5854 RepID=A0A2P9D5H1_PLARE|nr:rifin PIR protein, putative [Plasmodium reichenowi]
MVNTHTKPSIIPHTPKIPTTRLLCECELYTPVNYENDPQMKTVMENFNKQTQQRFQEYDDRMKTTRQKCKDQCDKGIQKIILKDKLEKQMEEQLTTLETKIHSDDIPTCICEKSIAHKVEKGCLRCGGVLGGGIAPGWGFISNVDYCVLTNVALIAATKKGFQVRMAKSLELMKKIYELGNINGFNLIEKITEDNFVKPMHLVEIIHDVTINMCSTEPSKNSSFCFAVEGITLSKFLPLTIIRAGQAASAGKAPAEIAKSNALSEASPTIISYSTAAIASIVEILVVVLIMIIIYLILCYRRKKRMKKKLQYIKLLKK